jgi:hypothetical protein
VLAPTHFPNLVAARLSGRVGKRSPSTAATRQALSVSSGGLKCLVDAVGTVVAHGLPRPRRRWSEPELVALGRAADFVLIATVVLTASTAGSRSLASASAAAPHASCGEYAAP